VTGKQEGEKNVLFSCIFQLFINKENASTYSRDSPLGFSALVGVRQEAADDRSLEDDVGNQEQIRHGQTGKFRPKSSMFLAWGKGVFCAKKAFSGGIFESAFVREKSRVINV